MNSFVYGLIDPDTLMIRYVGQTRVGMSRIMSHRKANLGDRTYRANWIRSLKVRGLTFDFVILEFCPEPELSSTERWWIRYGRLSGWSLTNLNSGGGDYPTERSKGRKRTPEQRRVISERAKERARTAEGLAHLSRASKGSVRTAEFKSRVSAKLKNRPRPADVCEKISKAWTPERKVSQAAVMADVNRTRIGKPVSEHARQSNRARWTPERRAAQGAATSKRNRRRADE